MFPSLSRAQILHTKGEGRGGVLPGGYPLWAIRVRATPKGIGFAAVLVIIRALILAILVLGGSYT